MIRELLIAMSLKWVIVTYVPRDGVGDWATPVPECGTFFALIFNSEFVAASFQLAD
jgi:hypothetical protein